MGIGFVFEKAVDEFHQRERGEPRVFEAVRGVEREFPGFGRNLDVTARLQIIKAAFDVRGLAHFIERTDFAHHG